MPVARMNQENIQALVASMMAERAASADGPEPSISAGEMAEVMSHPLALEHVSEMLEREPGSCGPGTEAPDFCLLRVDGGGSVRLSDHLGKRPVALIFGSYT